MYPLKFRPILKTLVWGGEKIASYKNIETDRHNIGESWELSGVKGDESVIANGEFAGMTISELLDKHKEKIVGRANYEKYGNYFPLLIKFIDADKDLSIQVHPDDELAARRHNGARGKIEMWYVVSADKNAHLISGFAKKISPEEYVSRVSDHTITEVLKDYKVHAGDVFYIPAGRIHSIGAGSFIAEIQQASDISYRIYDFGRPGLDGKPRELHTGLAREAIDYSVSDDYRTHYTHVKNKETRLVECDRFTTDLLEADRPFRKDLSDFDSFLAVVCTAGKGSITDSEGNRESLRQGETVLIPASATGIELVPEGSLTVLTSFV